MIVQSRSDSAVLEVDDLRVTYESGAVGLQRLDLTVQAGKIVAIVGPNGAGKTSALRGIGGVLPAQRLTIGGKVRFHGRDVTAWPSHRIARVGVYAIPDRRKVFPNLTVHDNLFAVQGREPRQFRRERFQEALQHFPMLQSRLRDPAGLLSGGQQQMLALARGFMLRADLLLIDEMTLGIHQALRPALFESVRALADSGAGVVMVDESVALVGQHADELVVLENGEVAGRETSGDANIKDLLDRVYSGGGNGQ